MLLIHAANGQSYTVESVPNTKLVNNSYVSNPDLLISDNAVTTINKLLLELEDSTTTQVAVVMLKSIGEADHIEFAQALFEQWGIGQANKDNGLLILFVEDQHTIRFHTGFGIEGILTDALSKRIQMQHMVPLFKEGRIDDGMIAGVEQVVKTLYSPDSVDMVDQESAEHNDFVETIGVPYFIALMLVVTGFFRIKNKAANLMHSGDYRSAYDYLNKKEAYRWWSILFPLPFAFTFKHFGSLKRKARIHSRPCVKCKTIINAALSEDTEDAYLTKQYIFEEKLKSVDYDVWRCASCNEVHIERYISTKTKFSQCSNCNTYALYTASSHTKVAATTSSTGIEEITKHCKYCNKKTITEEVIPMISTSSDSSSSSSDSGGSWGGGDSGGGGASSSW